MIKSRQLRGFMLVVLVALQIVIPNSLEAGELLGRIHRLFGEAVYKGREPCAAQDGAIECLAENIDWLEHHIDTYGSIVAKQPDIWGEARLTKHRDEYERILFRELNQFSQTINAAIAQGDSSFLSQALALSAAASAPTITPAPAEGQAAAGAASATPSAVTANAQLRGAAGVTPGFSRFVTMPDEPFISLEPVTHLDQMSRYLKHLHELRRINEGDDTSDSPGYSLNLVRIPVSVLPGKLTREGFGAEITITAEPLISDDLLPTTFRNLAVNDAVDFLGLPLVRVTERLDEDGLRANETKLILEYATDNINEMYENTAQDGFVERATPYISRVLDNPLAVRTLVATYEELAKKLKAGPGTNGSDNQNQLGLVTSQSRPGAKIGKMSVEKAVQDAFQRAPSSFYREQFIPTIPPDSDGDAMSLEDSALEETDSLKIFEELIQAIRSRNPRAVANSLLALGLADAEGSNTDLIREHTGFALDRLENLVAGAIAIAPAGRTRRALNPLSPSTLAPVIGVENLVTVSEFFNKSYYGRSVRWAGGPSSEASCENNRVDLLDARRFLNAEINAAYELLSEPRHVAVFHRFTSSASGLAKNIRSRHDEEVEQARYQFFRELHDGHQSRLVPSVTVAPVVPEVNEHTADAGWIVSAEAPVSGLPTASADLVPLKFEKASNPVEALAWAIVVESALLNERLNQDVRKLAVAKQADQLNTDQEYSFFLPDSVASAHFGLEELNAEYQLANEIFKRYVEERWPIHVFAIDPVAQQQNVADASRRKRELQFALALGFATGQIGINSLTQYSRQLETQVETLSLNQTIVGFGHGTDTFGWRFYPRVQALDVPGTMGSIRETIRGTSRDYDLRHRQIEAGQRECVAVVLMPSFVPYADFDIRSNWFKLTNPKNAALTMKESVRLSRAVTAMRNSHAQCAKCQHLYREGELRRLFKRVDQLDRELPLQTQRALVPYENTLGGFEMFNTGVTDLAPELIGWYGAPGVNCDDDYSCGCYQACDTIRAECTGATECEELNEALTKVNATLESIRAQETGTARSTPLPACQGQGTTLFLVGDNFSVHDAKVIAGGVCIPHVRLISRELMQVTIPSCVNTVKLCENGSTKEYVSVYVATPYGVTNHLHVPKMESKSEANVSEEIQKAVNAAVATLDIPPRVATITPPADNSIVKLTAIPIGDQGHVALNEQLVSGKRVTYKGANDPRFQGQLVQIKAAVRNGTGFVTSLADIKLVEFDGTTELPALGEHPTAPNGLLHLLMQRLRLSDIPPNGTPLKLKIVYYADLNNVLYRLTKEADLEVARAMPTEDANENTVPDPGSEASLKLRRPNATSTKLASVRPCPCDDKQYSQQLTISTADRLPVVPVQFNSSAGLNSILSEGLIDSAEAREGLERIESTLREAIENQEQAIVALNAATTAASSRPLGDAQLNVNVSVPPQVDPPSRLHDRRSNPILNHLRTDIGEKWRNLRDRLPGS